MAAVTGFAVCKLDGRLSTDWAPIIPNGSWMGMTVVNDSGALIELCTDPDDEMTVAPIADQTLFSIQAVMAGGPDAVRFLAGQVAFYLRIASGDGTGAYCTWA